MLEYCEPINNNSRQKNYLFNLFNFLNATGNLGDVNKKN